MKLSHFLIIALFGGFVMLISCSSKKEDPATDQTTIVTPEGSDLTQDPTMATPTLTSGTGEAHFKCPKNCVGGTGDAKGKCPVCGEEMEHNQAFHSQGATPGASAASPIKVDPSGITTGTPNATTVQPGQTPATTGPNAKGVWHYTCSKGCAGGASAQGNCATCGNALTHNQAFHQ